MIGVDEAGKGAVVGSMYVAAVRFDAGFGVPDSKRLSSDERERLAERVRDECNVGVVEVTADEVDAYVGEGGGMNDLMVEAHARAVDALDAPGRVVCDASDVSAERFARRVGERVPNTVEAEHGADETYDSVGAASVSAKVERDASVSGYGAGSGYPGDTETVEYLREKAPDYPAHVRESWSTAERIAREKEQTGFDDF
ncbi:ribonuclease HII [Haladaptatus sp. F3-133]|jgi:ribonuclease HII|uniref:Ribonuclease n=1 Tax=Halorutilus salinus TaxID=2487751 RepID=A0A9Q4GGT7_9EURY|nr:ribonuclease HII [Halorutilus salinus]MCX2819484.1 ribonuclease HII [Halorutilus salinus]